MGFKPLIFHLLPLPKCSFFLNLKLIKIYKQNCSSVAIIMMITEEKVKTEHFMFSPFQHKKYYILRYNFLRASCRSSCWMQTFETIELFISKIAMSPDNLVLEQNKNIITNKQSKSVAQNDWMEFTHVHI